MEQDVSWYLSRDDQMTSLKSNWTRILQQCTDFILPRRNSNMFYTGASSQIVNQPPQTKGEKVFDGTAIWANEQLAAMLSSNVTSSTQRWFTIEAQDESLNEAREHKKWFEYVTNIMYAIFNMPHAFFHQQTHEMYLDLGALGTSCQYVAEEFADVPARFQTFHISEINFLENNRGVVDTVHRKFPFSARQAMQQWGVKAPAKIKEIWDKGKEVDRMFDFLHCVHPREVYSSSKADARNKKFVSRYIFVDAKEFVGDESGYDEQPYMITRWSKLTGELLGRSPGMTCLPDVLMLNEMMKTIIKAAQKAVSPPLLVPDDGFLLPVTTVPDGINYFRSDAITKDSTLKYLESRSRFEIGNDLIQKVTKHILRCFYCDLSQLQEGPEMTATEFLQRQEERMRLMSPAIGRVHGEYCNPMIERVFNIASRKGLIPVPPRTLQDRPLKVKYVSPVVKAQKMTQAMMVQRMFDTIMPFAQVKPEIPDHFSGAGIAKWFMNIFDAPEDIRASEKEVAAALATKQREGEQQGGINKMVQASEGLKNIAPLLELGQGGNGAQ